MQGEQSTESFDILVVDDEPPIYDILSRTGKKVFPEARFINTRSAQETIEYLDTHPDHSLKLILLDIDLKQGKDGLTLLPELRSRFKGRIPIIMLSVVDEETKISLAYERGAVAYTQKPEDMQGWQDYVLSLRDYWHRSARLPGSEPR